MWIWKETNIQSITTRSDQLFSCPEILLAFQEFQKYFPFNSKPCWILKE